MSSGYGQRGGGGGGYEAPACVQNAMMTKDKKPFTYTPGGIDLSQIKSERMAKRLARNAQAEGATGASQQNRPTQPISPGSGGGSSGSPGAAAAMGAAAMGMPFQVLPPPPPPPQPGQAAGKKPVNGNNVAAPPPPPPQSTLAPPGRGNAPGSPATARKSPTPQRFEPPPLGFRPEIKIPSNPMAALRKVPPPVEKNTFWKDEYVKERSKSPLPETAAPAAAPSPPSTAYNGNDYSSNYNSNNNNSHNLDAVDGYNRPVAAPPSVTTQPATPQVDSYSNGAYNNISYTPYTPTQQPEAQQLPTPPATPPQKQQPTSPPQQQQQQQQQPRQEFRSVPMPQSPAVPVYTRQAESPRSPFEQPQRSTESPFQQQRPATAISPLAQAPQQQTPSQTVPWRTQRNQAAPQAQSSHPEPIYNNVQQQQQQQRSREVFSPGRTEPVPQSYGTQQSPYQAPKPTNVGSLYIAPLAQPSEPQAQRIILQQQAAGPRDSPMRQLPQQQQQQQLGGQPLGWLRSQPASKEQAPWARAEENGNVLPSTLRQTTPAPQQQQQQQQHQIQQTAPQTLYHQPQMSNQGNGYAAAINPQHNFGSNAQNSGLRLQINLNTNASNNTSQTGPRERIIPITLEQTPTYAAAQPNFGAPAGHIIRSANQFVDQGYNNYPVANQTPGAAPWREPSAQRVTSPPMQQQQSGGGVNNTTRIIPISIEGGRGGPISQSPVVLQNDPRSPPIQSKSFRILQKITDTVDDGSPDGTNNNSPQQQQQQQDGEPQLQRPQFARQMSAQQARHSPTIEQMRRLQINQDQTGTPLIWSPQGNGVPMQNRYTTQRSLYDTQSQPHYVPPSEQQAPEPKKYTGSAIPSRSFKILQAMTTPENAGPGQSDL